MERGSRMSGIFNPHFFNTITIVGAGATGSNLVNLIVRSGVYANKLNVYDYDKVEEHNLGNQIYNIEDVGMLKVEALKNHIAKISKEGFININPEKVKRIKGDHDIVLLCTDSNDSNKTILRSLHAEHAIRGCIANWGLEVNYIPRKSTKAFARQLVSDKEVNSNQLYSTCHVRQDMNFIGVMCACVMFQKLLLLTNKKTPIATTIVDFRDELLPIEAKEEQWSKM